MHNMDNSKKYSQISIHNGHFASVHGDSPGIKVVVDTAQTHLFFHSVNEPRFADPSDAYRSRLQLGGLLLWVSSLFNPIMQGLPADLLLQEPILQLHPDMSVVRRTLHKP